jgi:hypothetical protein
MLRAWGFGAFGLGLLTVGEVSMDWNR